MGNDEKNGRINYIRDDFIALRREMQKGFKDLSAELRIGQEKSDIAISNIYEHCSDKRDSLEKKILTNTGKILLVDSKVFKLFFIGNGIGYLAGVITTAIVGRILQIL